MTTATTPPSFPASEPSIGPDIHRFTVDEYYRMAELGIIPAGKRVELIDGKIFDMSPISPEHAVCLRRIREMLREHLPAEHILLVQDPIRLSDTNEPEPDLAVARPKPDGYLAGHPGPADLLLVVEVSISSRKLDLGEKARLYALHGIAEYWVVDVAADAVEVFRGASPAGYQKPQRFVDDTPFAPLAIPTWRVTPQQLLHD